MKLTIQFEAEWNVVLDSNRDLRMGILAIGPYRGLVTRVPKRDQMLWQWRLKTKDSNKIIATDTTDSFEYAQRLVETKIREIA